MPFLLTFHIIYSLTKSKTAQGLALQTVLIAGIYLLHHVNGQIVLAQNYLQSKNIFLLKKKLNNGLDKTKYTIKGMK